jgi:transcriptional regulator with XRE-family HTH domain
MGTHRVYREHKYAFGQQLLTLRTHIALTQLELAEQIGVHRRSVQNWETGESYPKAETLQRLIATPLLERLSVAAGGADALEKQLLGLLPSWRGQPQAEQGYGPGNVVNLLRVMRGELRGLDLARLAIRQAYLQGVEMQDTSLAGAALQDSAFTETFDAIMAVAVSPSGEYWAASSRRGEVRVWAAGGQILRRAWRAHADMVWALAFSPDGSTLASGSWDGTVKLWNLDSGALSWPAGIRAMSIVWRLLPMAACSPAVGMMPPSGSGTCEVARSFRHCRILVRSL